MLQLLLVGGNTDLSPPGTFAPPHIPAFYTQAMKNILAQSTLAQSIQMVNILSTVFKEVPDDLVKRLISLTAHKLMYHISKKFATAILNCNFQQTNLDLLSFETSSIRTLSFVNQNDSARVEEYHEDEQLAQNEHVFNIIEVHWKTLKSTIKGLGKITSMDYIVKISANLCCIITALFDIQPGNLVPVLYLTCIKMIEFIKHLDFIRWHMDVKENVPQLPYIYLNMLQYVLSHLASFSTNSVNNNLIQNGDDGSKLVIASTQKIVKYLARFFDRMENHILEGLYPNTIPKFTPRDANLKYKDENLKVASFISTIGNGALAISNKSKPDTFLPGTLANNRKTKKQKLKPAAGAKDFTKAGLFHCADGTPTSDFFLLAFLSHCVVISVSTTKNVPSLTRHANPITLGNVIKFLMETRQRFWLIAICLMERKSGLTRIHLQSTGRPSPSSFLIS